MQRSRHLHLVKCTLADRTPNVPPAFRTSFMQPNPGLQVLEQTGVPLCLITTAAEVSVNAPLHRVGEWWLTGGTCEKALMWSFGMLGCSSPTDRFRDRNFAFLLVFPFLGKNARFVSFCLHFFFPVLKETQSNKMRKRKRSVTNDAGKTKQQKTISKTKQILKARSINQSIFYFNVCSHQGKSKAQHDQETE